MNLSPRWADYLTEEGHQATHWSSVGAPCAPDTEIMSFAHRNDFTIITHDLDFGAILAATNAGKPSVVQIRSDDLSPERIGPQVLAALAQMEQELQQGALLSIDAERARLRLLPFRE